jgi:dUTP pyrophosphatase
MIASILFYYKLTGPFLLFVQNKIELILFCNKIYIHNTMSVTPELVLKLFVPYDNATLRAFYRNRIQDHNAGRFNTFPDSGFDLGLPSDFNITKVCSNKIPLGIQCAMYMYVRRDTGGAAAGASADLNTTIEVPQAYYLYPRSSIIKTPLRLSNSVGIIDSGYRGEITAVVDKVDNQVDSFQIRAMDRYFQLCHPSLMPFKVIIVDTIEELGLTARGDGGFGSTGR